MCSPESSARRAQQIVTELAMRSRFPPPTLSFDPQSESECLPEEGSGMHPAAKAAKVQREAASLSPAAPPWYAQMHASPHMSTEIDPFDVVSPFSCAAPTPAAAHCTSPAWPSASSSADLRWSRQARASIEWDTMLFVDATRATVQDDFMILDDSGKTCDLAVGAVR